MLLGSAPARLLPLHPHLGPASGLLFRRGMPEDHAVTPGTMKIKLFSILPCHSGRKENASES